MQCLVYVSAACGRPQDLDLGSILQQSRRNNAADGITGMLLYAQGNFMQALEGEAAVVERVYQRISCDKRHRRVTLLDRFEIAARQFPNWSMALSSLGDLSPEDQADCVASLTQWSAEPDVRAITGEIQTLLGSFMKSMR
jgi:hypothetical protein